MSIDYFATSPLDDPLSYPGLIPPFSYVLTSAHALRPLTSPELAGLSARHPVVAVGSNAAPAQLARKFFGAGLHAPVYVVQAVAAGLRVLPSAHINRRGYVPWAPHFDPAASASVFVTYLSDEQLARLDETEPNYLRFPSPPVHLDGSPELVEGCDIYRSRQGVITDDRVLTNGLLPAQPDLLDRLLTLLPELRDAGISSVAELVAALRTERVEASWVTGLIQDQLATGP